MDALRRRVGRLGACAEVRPDCSEWEVEVEGRTERAVAFPSLAGPLRPGDWVLLNTTAVALGLGTGGRHFVLARCEPPSPEDAPAAEAPFPGREAGHVLKLRYTPLQLRVMAAEEEASPHRQAVLGFRSLEGAPVLGAELHSQAGAAVLAARACAPGFRIALIQMDTAALPLSLSRLVARLRAEGILDATITVGQAFGGDYEAVNIYTGLIVAREVVGADLIVVTQGPGNVGTGTEYGFSGLGLAEAFHACDTLGGAPFLAPRLSEADPRPRHRGISHHTRTLLRCTRVPVTLPLPPGFEGTLPPPAVFVPASGEPPEELLKPLLPYRGLLTTMGRSLDDDPLFFQAAAGAGWAAALHALAARKAP
jgi:hypothetical protein